MLISVDCETQGLNCQAFLMGTLTHESLKTEFFYNKTDMWNRILELGKAQLKQRKILNVYAHNHQYDMYAYGNILDNNLKFFSFDPFIAAYNINGKDCIKFLDTYAIYKMSLKKIGDIIGYPKLDIPEELKLENYDPEIIQDLIKTPKFKDYAKRDSEIVMKAVQYIIDKCRKDGINIKRFYTINQIAIQSMLTELRKHDETSIFYIPERNMVIRPKHPEEIHKAYRGGRVECFKYGKLDNLYYIDCNSLYPYSLANMRFPKLESERIIYDTYKKFKPSQILSFIGISKALIINKNNTIGLIPVRTKYGNYYPKQGSYILGTYTHKELAKSIQEGYEIIKIYSTILYDEQPNPFTKLIYELYEKRKSSEFDNYFYKMLMNASIGKMAQTRINQEIKIDNVEKCEDYISKGYSWIDNIDYNLIYVNQSLTGKKKNYYCPIIPTLVNAYARCYMYDNYKKTQNLVYTDTDSIIAQGTLKKHNYIIGKQLGQFKIKYENTSGIFWGRKTYNIGTEFKASGIHVGTTTKTDFDNNLVLSTKMVTLKSSNNMATVGSFVTEQRDLSEVQKHQLEINSILDKQNIYIDEDIKDYLDALSDIPKILNSS